METLCPSLCPSLIVHFEKLEDPRVVGRTAHRLLDIIVITVCAVISGAESWPDVADYAVQKQAFLRRFLWLGNGVPSHDTFRRVFTLIQPQQIQACFMEWARSQVIHRQGEVISFDGKTIRRSFDQNQDQHPLHLVSAWAHDAGLVLGQEACAEKSNEITAIPKLLDLLDLNGKIVTTDALGCQKAIARQVRTGGGDYVLALKSNHRNMHSDVRSIFAEAKRQRWRGYEYDWYETTETAHGRKERRKYWTIKRRPVYDDICSIWHKDPWPDLNVIGMVESQRTQRGRTCTEVRYYLSSLANDAEVFAGAVRGHWHIENKLHWVLDVVFREDDDRNRTGHAQHNLALIRRLALSLLKQETTHKGSLKGKRKRAGWNDDYLLKVLGVENNF